MLAQLTCNVPACLQEQVERDREMVEAIVARIDAEDHATEAKRQASRQSVRSAMEQSLDDRQHRQATLKAAEAAEEHRCVSCLARTICCFSCLVLLAGRVWVCETRCQ